VHLPSACPGSGHPRRAWFSPPAPDAHGLAPLPSIAGAASTLHTSYDSDSTSWVAGNAGGQSVTNSPPGLRPAPATPQAEDRASTLGSATATATRRRRRRLRVRRRRDRATGAVAGGLCSNHSVVTHHGKRTRNGSNRPSCWPAAEAPSFFPPFVTLPRFRVPFQLVDGVFYLLILFKKSLLTSSKLVPLHVFTFHFRSR